MNPYETLGVSKNASKETVKRAYRKKARAAHPDTGGSVSDFNALNAAYRLLSDDSARARYDETGETEPSRHEQVVAGILASAYMAVLSEVLSHGRPGRIAYAAAMKRVVMRTVSQLKGNIKKMEQAVTVLEDLRERFEDGQTFVDLTDGQLAQVKRSMASAKQQLEAEEEALRRIKACKYRADAATPDAATGTSIWIQSLLGGST